MGQLETGILTALSTAPAVTNVVGTRVRPLVVGEGEDPPYVTYTVTDRKSEATLAGEVSDYHTAEFEVGVYARSYDTVMDLSDAVRDRLDQFGQTVAGVEFAPCQFDTETDVEQVTPEGEELPVYLRTQTYKVLYRIVA